MDDEREYSFWKQGRDDGRNDMADDILTVIRELPDPEALAEIKRMCEVVFNKTRGS